MERLNTGWRRLAPEGIPHAPPIEEASKRDLHQAARLAVEALKIKPAVRYVLDKLVGSYGGEPLLGRLLVWPSNEWLELRTGLTERTIRYAIASLVSAGVVAAKDSANGKRFAIRSKSGQIVDAYGFDLSPLLARRQEFEDQVDVMKAERRRRELVFHEITICRRAAQEALQALAEWFPAVDTNAYHRALEVLLGHTPRRSSKASPDAALEAWRDLRERTEAEYNAACAGKNSRLIKNNNDAPDQSCIKRPGENGAPGGDVSLTDLAAACPDAFAYVADDIRNPRELVGSASRLRGMLGAHESAWDEAVEKIGPVPAAAAVFIVLQHYEADQNGGKRQIRNPGGYFRSFCRMVAEGRVQLHEEIATMKRRRRH